MPEEVRMGQMVMTFASMMVGVGCALMLEGIFPALATWPLAVSLAGGLFSGSAYYAVYRITA